VTGVVSVFGMSPNLSAGMRDAEAAEQTQVASLAVEYAEFYFVPRSASIAEELDHAANRTSAALDVSAGNGEVVLGTTEYASDITWTADKTYILNGSVLVKPGATPNTETGTVVKVAEGKYIRVGGALVARGTVERPIIFVASG